MKKHNSVAMKDRSNIATGAYDESTQYASDNSNTSNNSQDSITSESNASGVRQSVPESREQLLSSANEEGILNKKTSITLDLSMNAPTRTLSNVHITRAFASFDGIGVHSGVPTRTTPTLTPTTLKNINEQTFLETTNDAQINLPYQAGFVPPPYPMEDHSQDGGVSQESLSSNSNSSWRVSGSHGYTGDDLDSKSSASLEQPPTTTNVRRSAFALANAGGAKGELNLMDVVGSFGTTGSTGTNSSRGGSSGRRNVGGRRPYKPSNLTPEEEEKRRIRRERNKQAAARCRRRREDHTNELVDETDQLEKKRLSLSQEIHQLQQEKEDLEFLLESHREHCRLQVRRSPIDLKPADHMLESIAPFVLPKIKTEPDEEFPHHQHQHSTQAHLSTDSVSQDQPDCLMPVAKKLKLSNALSDSLETPTPTSIAFVPLSTPGHLVNKSAAIGSTSRPTRPDSLDVKSAAQYPSIARSDVVGAVGNSTPSSGLFNFDSLMEGGTGLTPIAAPINLPPNRNPLELITPTSTEPSKLCSL